MYESISHTAVTYTLLVSSIMVTVIRHLFTNNFQAKNISTVKFLMVMRNISSYTNILESFENQKIGAGF